MSFAKFRETYPDPALIRALRGNDRAGASTSHRLTYGPRGDLCRVQVELVGESNLLAALVAYGYVCARLVDSYGAALGFDDRHYRVRELSQSSTIQASPAKLTPMCARSMQYFSGGCDSRSSGLALWIARDKDACPLALAFGTPMHSTVRNRRCHRIGVVAAAHKKQCGAEDARRSRTRPSGPCSSSCPTRARLPTLNMSRCEDSLRYRIPRTAVRPTVWHQDRVSASAPSDRAPASRAPSAMHV